jgi:oxygen-independent coproporphyrinogen-3 oxidase
VFRKEDKRLIEKYVLPQLQQPLDDGLINMNEDGLVVTETGRQFIRNICSAFDLYLQREMVTPMFSKAI